MRRRSPRCRYAGGVDPLHPYDNQTRTFQHTDEPARLRDGLALVGRLLQWPTTPEAAWFHMSFYSGGCGIFDRIQLAVPLDAARLSRTIVRLRLRQAIAEGTPELCWLMGVEEDTPAGRWAAAQEWLAEERGDFQPMPAAPDALLAAPGSDVNSWTVLWVADDRICLLAYDQG